MTYSQQIATDSTTDLDAIKQSGFEPSDQVLGKVVTKVVTKDLNGIKLCEFQQPIIPSSTSFLVEVKLVLCLFQHQSPQS